MKVVILWLMVCLLLTAPLSAQDTALPATDQVSWDVFLRNSEEDAATELVFINILTGEMNSVSVLGERFTLLGKAVIYYDLDEEQVKLAAPDASIQDHPFISKSADTERVDWVVSKDRQSIAWTATRRTDGAALSTATYVSDLGGADRREVLLDGPRESLRVLPIAFSPARDELIMAIQPDGISEHFAYTRHAGLFALNLADGALRELPDETGCYCAAGFGEDVMLRFPPSSNGDGFEAVVHKLDGSGRMVIGGALPDGFTSPGEVLVSADDNLALYVVSQVAGLGAASGETRSVFVLADLQTAEQSLVSNPITGLVRRVTWAEDSDAVLFTSDQQLGAWKLRLSDGMISEVASALYLGGLHG